MIKLSKVKTIAVTPVNIEPKHTKPKRTDNYNKLGEVTKRINRQMESHKKKYGKSEEFTKIQNYIKGLSSNLRQYNRKKGMWELKTPRTQFGKEKIKEVQNTVQQNFLTIKEIETAKKIIGKKGDRKYTSSDIFKRAIELAYLIQNYGTEAISGYNRDGVEYIDMYIDDINNTNIILPENYNTIPWE